MKSSLGKILRKIRKGKNISLTFIADKYLSKSQISRFERGESEISCIRLINILDKMNVTLDEFMILYNNDNKKNQSFIDLLEYIRKAYSEQEVDTLINLLNTQNNFQLSKFDKTMIKSILYTIDSSIKPSQEELLELTDYLFKVEFWGYYEIILLGNCAPTIDYSSLILLTREMLRNYIYSSLNKNNKKLVTQLAINCLITSIEHRKFNDCNYLIKKIKKLLDGELNYYEQTVFLYAEGFFEFKKSKNKGKEKMEQALQVFEILGDTTMLTNYTEHYLKIINGSTEATD
ncbi:Positive transcriptional regulator, MutRfamily [Streptococcus infantarius subsp. infantarius]|nr:Positive transcriptional regulator, MutRfamily [Streptococcus infantarius subsp. infantarius]